MTRAPGVVDRLGDRAIRFARPDAPARAIVREIKRWPGVVDVVVTREDVGVYFDAEPRIASDAIEALATVRDDASEAREHVLRAVYDGVDLEEVARLTARPVADVIARHQAAIYTVDTMGFVPGFAYLDGLDSALELPRRTTPRDRVPAGAIAIAGTQTAVYPFDSAGGWHVVGRVVDVTLFDDNGALLAIGDRVRFVA